MVYEYVYCNSSIRVTPPNPQPKVQRSPLALLQTCRQIRLEARAAFFKHTTFTFRGYCITINEISRYGSATHSAIQMVKLIEGGFGEEGFGEVEVTLVEASPQEFRLSMMSHALLSSLRNVRISIFHRMGATFDKNDLVAFTRDFFGIEDLNVELE
jgi:hypothetical protein